jgi:hypothetical protein
MVSVDLTAIFDVKSTLTAAGPSASLPSAVKKFGP